MKLGRIGLICACALALAAACGESHGNDPDAAISFDFDAHVPDAGPDAGPPPSNVGTRCESDDECAASGEADYCEPNLGGYCTTFCGEGLGCPTGSICAELGRGLTVCLATCDPAAEGDQCLAGNGCSNLGGGVSPVCLPGCEDDTDCGDGLSCLAGAGDFGAGVCIDPEAELGGACTRDRDCPPSAQCVNNPDYPGGTCILVGCNPNTNVGCPGDAQCLPDGGGGGICWDGCESGADCREAWECASQGGRNTCRPIFVDENLGQVCSAGRGSCAGGTCFNETLYGFPDSYCAGPNCDPEASEPTCPGDGVCASTTGGGGICVDGCTEDTDCRDAYRCRPVDREDPTRGSACFPGCSDDSQCTAMSYGSPSLPYVCNVGTGYCAEPFNPSELGAACTESFWDCRGGRCLTAGDGWPGGTCTYPGCSLSGATPAATCPEASVCIDDETGDPDIGVCVSACTVGEDTCRTGYACVALGDDATEGACRPAS